MCSITASIIILIFCTATTMTSPIIAPACVDLTAREEIRTVSAVDRTRLLAEYKRERRTLGPRRFATAIASKELCEIVKRIDKALAPQRMPYWDSRWDLRLPRPSDSVIFSENFFPKTRRRRAKEKLPRET
ncbi:hypothetical protein OESDEN_09699 [Oesophagostomum dentatum]|uniref:Uncharacterized protein n=1 Tax=Oesophagostomum dentatum TaxID=61180 RepID=A0A0B1T4Y0_OESDE|nr:hypothetical protein OESDEN_09699 [Oesophagostomum dentatum]